MKHGEKFLGTVTLSTSAKGEFEVIDGQQRITVITLFITYMNSVVKELDKFSHLCTISNLSFPKFEDAFKYQFDYGKIEAENPVLFKELRDTDVLDQMDIIKSIWDSIVKRVEPLSPDDKKKLLQSLLDSELNVIINILNNLNAERKFCIDYFIDINNKSVHLDSLDIIRAYAFKENFEMMTQKWIDIQNKCKRIQDKVKYPRESLFYHYFICRVNNELGNQLKRLGEDYRIKEDVTVNNRAFAKGTFVWNMFSKDTFYSEMLLELDEFLDFISVVLSGENGGNDSFKSYFKSDKGKMVSTTGIMNAHIIINGILRHDDVVPKMMILKYFLFILRQKGIVESRYKVIYHINVIATLFSTSGKRKSSDLIASKLLLVGWQDALAETSYRQLKDFPNNVDFSKQFTKDKKITIESGQYMARRLFALLEAYSWEGGNTSFDAKKFKDASISNGTNNMEHFLVNRNQTYSLYLDDGETVELTITAPGKLKKWIATVANYLVLNETYNGALKNRPVYEKIELLKTFIARNGIEAVIPNKRSQKHYLIAKDVFHDQSVYPKDMISGAKKKTEKRNISCSIIEIHFQKSMKTLFINYQSNRMNRW